MMGWVECSVLFHPTFFCSTLVLALLLSLYVHFFGYSGLSFGWNSFSVCLCTFDAWVKMTVCLSFCWVCFCFRSIYSFRFGFNFFPSFAFHFNVISLSRWKIFMANGSVFYTQPVVIAKSCSKQITSTNSEMGLCCLCIFFPFILSRFLSPCYLILNFF